MCAGNEILLVAERRAAVLARRLTQLCALWSRATHAVYERYKSVHDYLYRRTHSSNI